MAVTLILHHYTGLPFCGMRVPKIESLYINPDNPDGAIKCAALPCQIPYRDLAVAAVLFWLQKRRQAQP
jgi:hypothetical protein